MFESNLNIIEGVNNLKNLKPRKKLDDPLSLYYEF